MSAGAGLVFKGSGFYITDYGKDGKKDQRAASKSPSTKKEGSTAESSSGSAAESPAPADKPSEAAKKDSTPTPPAASSGE